jgi:hypothetical protein
MSLARRFGLHLAAAVGATGIFVAAVAVGAQQNRPQSAPITASTAQRVVPERSLTGTVREVSPNTIVIQMARGRQWRVTPFPGALIRLNNRQVALDALQVGDRVVILGQQQDRESFKAHAITARRRN